MLITIYEHVVTQNITISGFLTQESASDDELMRKMIRTSRREIEFNKEKLFKKTFFSFSISPSLEDCTPLGAIRIVYELIPISERDMSSLAGDYFDDADDMMEALLRYYDDYRAMKTTEVNEFSRHPGEKKSRSQLINEQIAEARKIMKELMLD